VEVEHESVLPGYEPFGVAHQAEQVYCVPFPCKSIRDLVKRWVVYNVRQLGTLPTLSSKDYEVAPRSDEFLQEEGLDGSLIIDLGDEFDVSYNIERDVEEVI
jgi:hypothetical protein